MKKYGLEYRQVYTTNEKELLGKPMYTEYFSFFFKSKKERNKRYKKLKNNDLVINLKKVDK
jgi:hypothetical protein